MTKKCVLCGEKKNLIPVCKKGTEYCGDVVDQNGNLDGEYLSGKFICQPCIDKGKEQEIQSEVLSGGWKQYHYNICNENPKVAFHSTDLEFSFGKGYCSECINHLG